MFQWQRHLAWFKSVVKHPHLRLHVLSLVKSGVSSIMPLQASKQLSHTVVLIQAHSTPSIETCCSYISHERWHYLLLFVLWYLMVSSNKSSYFQLKLIDNMSVHMHNTWIIHSQHTCSTTAIFCEKKNKKTWKQSSKFTVIQMKEFRLHLKQEKGNSLLLINMMYQFTIGSCI